MPSIAQSPYAVDGDERAHEQPVEPADDAASPTACTSRRGRRPRALGVDDFDAPSVAIAFGVVVAVVWKYCSKTFSAAGAAAVPPWPPFSITAQTTIVGASNGP